MLVCLMNKTKDKKPIQKLKQKCPTKLRTFGGNKKQPNFRDMQMKVVLEVTIWTSYIIN